MREPTSPQTTTKESIRVLLSRGYTPREIAKALDITTQAVYLFMKAIRVEAEALEAAGEGVA